MTSVVCNAVTKHIFGRFTATKTSLYNLYGKCYHQQYKLPARRQLRDDLSCEDNLGVLTLLNNYFTRKAFHASTNGQWQPCSDPVEGNYTMDPEGSYWIYPLLLKNYRITIYSGDADACVPITGTLQWLWRMQEELKLPIVDPYRPWRMGNVTGGMTATFGSRNTGELRFVSVRKAGHMVPKTQPELALHLLKNFLSDKPI